MKILTFLLASSLFAGAAGAATIEVKVEKLDGAKGRLFWALHKKDDFLKEGKDPFQGEVLDIEKAPLSFTIDDVPAGEYALVVFQDLDGNDELNTTLFSYPLEPFGFSKNPTIYFGPPSFSKAAFKVKEGQDATTQLEIKLK